MERVSQGKREMLIWQHTLLGAGGQIATETKGN